MIAIKALLGWENPISMTKKNLNFLGPLEHGSSWFFWYLIKKLMYEVSEKLVEKSYLRNYY